MTMILPHFSDYNQNESVDFLNRLTVRIAELDLETLGIKAPYDMLANKVTIMLSSYQPGNEQIATSQIVEADSMRDAMIISLKAIVTANASSYKTDMRMAALNISNSMEKYGDRIDKLSYVSETAATTSLVKELQTETQLLADMGTIHVLDIVNDLDLANKNFDTLYNMRLDQKEAHNEIKFATDLKEATQCCRNFYNLIESNAAFATGIDYTPLMIKLEMLSKEYNAIADKRISSTNKSTDDTVNEVEPSDTTEIPTDDSSEA